MMGRKGLVGRCSFCGKTPDQVKRLVAGPGVFICDQCVALCSEIISQGPPAPPAPVQRAGWIRSLKSRRWFGRLFHSEALQSG